MATPIWNSRPTLNILLFIFSALLLSADAMGARVNSQISIQPIANQPSTLIPAKTVLVEKANGSTSNPSVFNPGGYYFPTEGLAIGNYTLEWIALFVDEDHVFDGTGQGKPELKLTAKVVFEKADQSIVFDCPHPVITPNRLYLKCVSNKLGALTIQGEFIDKLGRYWDRPEIKTLETIVLAAQVVMRNHRKVIYSNMHQFTYWQGD